MKVALVIEHFDARRGGAEQWTCQFARRLLHRGFQVHVVCKDAAQAHTTGWETAALPIRTNQPAHIPPQASKSRHFGSTCARIGDAARLAAGDKTTAAGTARQSGIVIHRLGRCGRIAFAAKAEKLLRSLELDVIHDMGSGWYADVFQPHDGSRLAQWQQKLSQLPPWQQTIKKLLMSILPRYRAFRTLMHRQYSAPHRLIVALSRMCAEDIQQNHAVPPERIRIIYNGVDVARFDETFCRQLRQPAREALGIHDEETVLLFVGNDFRRKGLDTAIRALARVRSEGFRAVLAVAGSGPARQYLRLASQTGAADSVKMLGPVGDILRCYAAADVLVLPTWYDPCSLAVLEAAACGLPSVTTRHNGAGELLRHGVSGMILADPGDDVQLAAHLRLLMSNLVRQEMARQARKVALRQTLDHNCQQIVDVYQEVLGRKRKAA